MGKRQKAYPCRRCDNTGWQTYYRNCHKFTRLCPMCRGIETQPDEASPVLRT